MLHEPHIAPLTAFVAGLRRTYPTWEFPDFDPLDGGVDATILVLFEKPGRMTSAAAGGSGFISRDNDDPTAEATFRFMQQAGLPRTMTVTWNVVPGWNGARRVTAAELQTGVDRVADLLRLLPRLHMAVLVGKKAQRALPLIETLGLRVLASAHPSPIVRASRPRLWRQIPTD
jgi:Uracil DNA glycosylase superfamily